jgi:hypothetical protein
MSGTLSYVREEGDLSCFPTLPHDLGVKQLLHADSPFLKSTIPRNVTQKDFIRKAVAFKPNLTDYAVRVKRRDPKQRLTDATFADEALHAQIHSLKERLGRGDASRIGQCSDPSTASMITGPREHATTIMESEGIRGSQGARQTTILTQHLARHATAPIAAKPTPYHHFMFGGSKTQKRKLERKANQLQATIQANVQLKKQQLVDANTSILAEMAVEQATQMAAAGAAATSTISTSTAPIPHPEPQPTRAIPPQQAAESSSPEWSPASSSSPSAVVVSAGLGVVAVIAIAFALYRHRVQRKRR